MKNNKGITLLALIITIIVMVILAGIALLFSVGDSGVISRAEKTKFLEDMKLYKEELELYKAEKQIENQKLGVTPITTGLDINEWDYEDIVGNKYIPSMKIEYAGIIGILDGELAYMKARMTSEEEKMAITAGLIPYDEIATITVQIEGEGIVKINGEELLEVSANVGIPINLNAEPGQKQIGDKTVEYAFLGWYEDGECVEKNAEYNFTVQSDRELVARFGANATIIYLDDGSVELNTNDTISGYSDRADIIKVEIRDGVVVEKSSFVGCTNLKEVIIGNNITLKTVHAQGSFGNCANLQTVKMGENIKITASDGWPNNPEKSMFYNCPNLETVTVISMENPGWMALKNTGTALKGHIIIKGTSIGAYAFEGCTNLGKVTIEDTVTSIYRYAFNECKSMDLTSFPKGLTLIERYSFYNCENITGKITINGDTKLEEEVFTNCLAIEKVEIKDNSIIPKSSFVGCVNLKEVIIGNNVTLKTVHAQGSFGNCSNLKTVRMGENIKITASDGWPNNPEKSMFYNCPNLETVTVISMENPGWMALKNTGTALKGNITIKGTSIGAYAFEGCTNLGKVTIEDTVTSIYRYAFNECKSMDLTSFPKGLTLIERYSFYNCENITGKITINGDTKIEEEAFTNCLSIEKVEIKDNAMLINTSFVNCTNLREVIIGNNVTLKTVYAQGSFGNCANLQMVKMGENIKITASDGWPDNPEYSAFHNCPKLETVTVVSLENPGWMALKNTGAALKGNITIKGTSIGAYAFDGCSKLEKVIIVDEITTIGKYAFRECTSLNTIDINMLESDFNSKVTFGEDWNKGVNTTINFLK